MGKEEVDINKVVRQHSEMDNFFTGGFAAKGAEAEREQAANDMRLSWPGARVDSPTC